MPAGPSLGEYAALIPILGTGMRGERRLRLQFTVAYGTILAIRSWTIAGSVTLLPLALLAWAAIIGLLWGVGNLFMRYRAALDEAKTAALQQQRLSLARELHDTVARDLVRASLRGQAAVAAEPSPEIEAVLREIHQASTHLRWLMALLREAEPTGFGSTASTGQSLARATESLRDHGLLVRTFVEGDLDAVPPALHPIVDAVVGEACANIERHADAGAPCAIMVNVSDDRLDAAFINHVAGRPTGAGYGLDGLRERLALVGGELVTEQEGTQWICRISLPL